ncbi:MAG TPA: regulatory protein RecX [Methylomirabilota bacterium]|jgi:regulatory protein|nr:regulatory protein RecX [Methylomirabilota bacterium]
MRRRAGRGAAAAPRVLDAARARVVALDLLSRKAWTRHDLLRRLRRRGAPAAVAQAVVADLEARGYVDDRAFAVVWAESRARGRGLGSRRLRQELLVRGVARAVVDDAVRLVAAPSDEAARARAAAARRLTALGGGEPERMARRLSAYLARRGFPPELVRRVVREHLDVAIPDE